LLRNSEIDVPQNEKSGQNPDQRGNFTEFANGDLDYVHEISPRLRPVAMLKVNGVASMVMKDGTASLRSLHFDL
jgi:hypothetical protein